MLYSNYFIASPSVPTFVQHIIGERVQEEETVTFEAVYKGIPAPGNSWLNFSIL